MRVFSAEAEELAFRHEQLRDWRAAGLLDGDSHARSSAFIGPEPGRAAWPLRVLLFGFAALMLGALALLVLKDFRGRAEAATAALFLVATAVAVAEALISSLKVRRFGAEEALVCGAVILTAFGAERMYTGGGQWRFSALLFSGTAALAAAAAYLRYGYRLASFGGAAALGVFVGALDYGQNTTRVMLAVLYATLLCAATWWPGLSRRERERLEIVRFFLAFSVPLFLNLRLERLLQSAGTYPVSGTFAYATLAALFVIPLVWLAWGAASRSRPLLWAGGIGLLVAQCSIKPYLGLARNSWDPITLGVELMAVALLLKRWLDAGPGRRRGAYSAEAMGSTEPGGALGLLAAAVAASPSVPSQGPGRFSGGGGNSGGGGASSGF
ncbi:MAG: hypothetical protein A2506_13135 [Elusimicrobia bacterium RIFOXYD12_FULL_66_9]|nr:MAG: hypothetical protein A2506_13135 [Elusimicrobia bacterium RIFOXYD12_FULL_66_9]